MSGCSTIKISPPNPTQFSSIPNRSVHFSSAFRQFLLSILLSSREYWTSSQMCGDQQLFIGQWISVDQSRHTNCPSVVLQRSLQWNRRCLRHLVDLRRFDEWIPCSVETKWSVQSLSLRWERRRRSVVVGVICIDHFRRSFDEVNSDTWSLLDPFPDELLVFRSDVQKCFIHEFCIDSFQTQRTTVEGYMWTLSSDGWWYKYPFHDHLSQLDWLGRHSRLLVIRWVAFSDPCRPRSSSIQPWQPSSKIEWLSLCHLTRHSKSIYRLAIPCSPILSIYPFKSAMHSVRYPKSTFHRPV